MTPPISMLLLTTLTGFGYGLLAWLGTLALLGALPPAPFFVPVAVVIALIFSTAGLIASTAHLGRPERAWRAFSQWRSSWLSREGVAAMLTTPPAICFAASWWWFAPGSIVPKLFGILTAGLALLTIFCTSMIYGSLKPIRQWHNPHTPVDYLIYAIFSGAMLLSALWSIWFGSASAIAIAAMVMAGAAAIAKFAYWRFIDQQKPLASLASAIGIEGISTKVRPLDQPHFTENYILREMGFQIARKHAAKLRRIITVIAFAVPAFLALLAAFSILPALTATLAACLALVGLFIERWLFFAEATHVSALYYGRG